MKNSNDTIGNRTRDLPACSAVPLPTAPPRGGKKSSVPRRFAACCCDYRDVTNPPSSEFKLGLAAQGQMYAWQRPMWKKAGRGVISGTMATFSLIGSGWEPSKVSISIAGVPTEFRTGQPNTNHLEGTEWINLAQNRNQQKAGENCIKTWCFASATNRRTQLPNEVLFRTFKQHFCVRSVT